jgi:hypothetical protein
VSESERATDLPNRYAASSSSSPSSASPMSRADVNQVGRPASRESLIDILDRVLDKGIVIAGDITVSLLDIELLTIKIRLLIASVDKAREMGIDWWAHDPQLSPAARRQQQKLDDDREKRELRQRIAALESRLAELAAAPPSPSSSRASPQLPVGARRPRGS